MKFKSKMGMIKRSLMAIGLIALSIAAIFLVRRSRDGFKSIQLIYHYPIGLSVNGGISQVNYLIDTITVSYLHGYLLYSLPSPKVWESGASIKENEPFFLFNKSDEFGYFFKTLRQLPAKLREDSFLVKNGMSSLSFNLPPDSSYRLVRSVRDIDRGGISEVYAARRQHVGLRPDSILFVFDERLRGYEFSLSKPLDSLKASKLCQVQIKFTARNDSPPREFFWEIKETPEAQRLDLERLEKQLIQKVAG